MRIYNMYRDIVPPGAVNIMRPSIHGNPFAMKSDGSDRSEVVLKHWVWLQNRVRNDPEYRKAVLDLIGHDLVCCCKPLACHGDNIIKIIEDIKNGRI
jgi:DNA-directed RNA polymerase subunit N (RpoN/RPB10)